jgi:hypothetical protein
MGLYLCFNCLNDKGVPGKPFEADLPVCPCGVDGRSPDMAAYVHKREVIHFDPPHAILKGRGVRKVACTGAAVGTGQMASGHPAAVNCRKCQETAEYAKACEQFGEPAPIPDADFKVA